MKKINILIIMILSLFVLVGCSEKQTFALQSFYLDNAFSITPIVYILDTEERLANVQVNEISAITNALDDKFNVNKKDSMISLVNDNAGISSVKTDKEFIDIVKRSLEIANETKIDNKIYYDITILPVWQLWDFSNKYYIYENFETIPTNDQISKVLEKVDCKKIEINEDEETVFLSIQGMKIDLGSIVKGYAADKIKEYLSFNGYENAMIDIGGNVLIMGKNISKDAYWKVGITRPYSVDGSVVGYIDASEEYQTFVTSGIYERYIFSEDKKMYHHILNPFTGYPMDNDIISITIVSKKSLDADGYSTAVFMMGKEKALDFINNHEDLQAVIIDKDLHVCVSNNLKSSFTFNEELLNEGYTY